LLAAINAVRVSSDSDFVPLSDAGLSTYGLEEGKQALRIEVGTPGEKKEAKEEIKKLSILVGFKVKDRDQYYVRRADDQGVVQIDAKVLEPIFDALRRPGQFRSRDLIAADTKNADAIDIRQGKKLEEVWKLRGPEEKDWKIYEDKHVHKADDKTVQA